MVTVEVPFAAVALAVKVSVLVEVVGFGLNCAVTPLGSPEAFKLTLPEKPLTGTTVIWLVTLAPCAMLTEVGFAVRLKSAAGYDRYRHCFRLNAVGYHVQVVVSSRKAGGHVELG